MQPISRCDLFIARCPIQFAECAPANSCVISFPVQTPLPQERTVLWGEPTRCYEGANIFVVTPSGQRKLIFDPSCIKRPPVFVHGWMSTQDSQSSQMAEHCVLSGCILSPNRKMDEWRIQTIEYATAPQRLCGASLVETSTQSAKLPEGFLVKAAKLMIADLTEKHMLFHSINLSEGVNKYWADVPESMIHLAIDRLKAILPFATDMEQHLLPDRDKLSTLDVKIEEGYEDGRIGVSLGLTRDRWPIGCAAGMIDAAQKEALVAFLQTFSFSPPS